MRIAHYNTFAEGGAAVVMLRLHDALRDLGHESRIRYRKGNILLPEAQRLEYCQGWMDRQRERLRHKLETWVLSPKAGNAFACSRLHKATGVPLGDASVDIVHLHWISRWLDLPSFLGGIPKHIPIVWTVHDMSPLAGGCFMDFGCDQIDRGCRRCPLLKFPFKRVLPARELARRSRALGGHRVFAVGNSASTTQLIKRSLLFRGAAGIETIHPGLDPRDFVRHNKYEAKRLLGIAPARFVLGFGAASVTDPNKGLDRFFDVAQRVGSRLGGLDALVIGDGLSAAGSPQVKVHGLGRLCSPLLLSLAYSAMDVFVVASRMETFGQVAAEAQACGTPVWGFKVGGLPDAVNDGVTGKLIDFPDACAMAESICDAYSLESLPGMGEQAAAWARQAFCVQKVAQRYVDLYAKALGSSSARDVG